MATFDINNLDITGLGITGLDSASALVWTIVWLIIGACALILAYWYLLHRHKVRLRMLTAQGSVPYDDKAREIKVDGVGGYWKLLKKKDIIPTPPSQALTNVGKDIFGKPKFYSEYYWSEEFGYVPTIDTVTRENIMDRGRTLQKDGSFKDTFQPFTPQQRSLLVGQLRKAQAKRRVGILDKLAQVATPMALIFIVILGLVFWEDIAKPSQAMAEANKDMMEQQSRLLSEQADISAQNARMVQSLTGDNLEISQRVPAG